MSEESKRAIEIIDRDIEQLRVLIGKISGNKDDLHEIREAYKLAITAIKQVEAVRAECEMVLNLESCNHVDDAVDEMCNRILEILEGKL